MTRLTADQRDYKEAFKKHYHAFINWGDTGSLISKNMILTYCVECGIKYLVMKKEGISTSWILSARRGCNTIFPASPSSRWNPAT